MRRYPALVGWGAATALIVAAIVAAPVLAPHDPNRLDLARVAPAAVERQLARHRRGRT